MFKNTTIGQITIILTLLLAFINAALVCFIHFNGWFAQYQLVSFIGFIFGSLLLGFIPVKLFIDYFVLNKIKIIYKMINDRKKSYSMNELDSVDSKSLTEVNDEVIEWSERREEEIVYLKELEDYRKSFLGNISHELKTPLFSIQGYIHTLLEGGVYDEKINIKYLKRTAANIDRLQSIVDDLEIINQLQSEKVSLVLEEFELRELVEDVRTDLEMMAKGESMQICYIEDVMQSFKVIAEKNKIRQVLVNLITNAIKYGQEGGSVMIGFYDLEDKVLIEITDNGIGIEEKHLKHLFDRFYRVDESRNRKYGGSGLGLSIVKHIIEAHGQTISVRSTINVGATFGFTLSKV